MSRTVVLVELHWARDKDPRVPLGHACLLAALEHAGVQVHSIIVPVNVARLYVDQIADTVLERACGRSPEEVDLAVGAYVWNEEIVRDLLRGLRAKGFRGRIILGGPQVSYTGPGLERLYPEADTFVRGYGEDALVRLAGSPGHPVVPGVHHAGNADRCEQASVCLQKLASPWLTDAAPLSGQRFVRWETQRGCPFHCAFCQHREPGARLRRRALARPRVMREIELLCRAGVTEIAVLDPIFNIGSQPTAVLERFAELGFRGRLSLQCRAECTGVAFLESAEALDVCLEFGLQTIHSGEARAVHRQNDMAKIDRVLAEVRRRGIDHEVSLIFGLPGQTLQSFVDTVRWCIERRVPTIKAFPLLLLRGTALERERDRWGFVDAGGPMPMVVRSKTFTRADWERMGRVAEALRLTEGRHPSTIQELLTVADQAVPDMGRWQAPTLVRKAA